MPNAEQIPQFVTGAVETPTFHNPLGAKGVGKGGTIGVPPAIVNAVLDTLAPLGIKAIDMLLKPEKIWVLVQAARSGTLQQDVPEPPPVFKAEIGSHRRQHPLWSPIGGDSLALLEKQKNGLLPEGLHQE